MAGRWCWTTFSSWGVLLIWIKGGQGASVLAVGAGGDCLEFFLSRYTERNFDQKVVLPSGTGT